MTDRDTFAAAALTGLLSNVQRYQNEPLTRQAYEIADFMLREQVRDSRTANTTTYDAATPPQGSVPDSGNWNEPVAWAAWFDDEDKPDADFLFRNKEQADCWCRKRGADSVPLYRHPQPTLTDEEREAVKWAADHLDASGFGSATLRKLLERLA